MDTNDQIHLRGHLNKELEFVQEKHYYLEKAEYLFQL